MPSEDKAALVQRPLDACNAKPQLDNFKLEHQ